MIMMMAMSPISYGEPSFEETRDWILSKVKTYSDPWEYSKKRATNSFNNDRASFLSITPCTIDSKITYKYDRTDAEINWYDSYYDYSGYDIVDISYFSYKKNNEYRELKVGFSTDVGEYTHYRPQISKSKRKDRAVYEYHIDKRSSSSLAIHFNYLGGEKDLMERLEKAFMHLRELAANNPSCTGANETF